MSLATRCFTCGTVFRVVQDQLKVSEGWVRCGRCNDVFNALETLFDLDRDTPPEWTPPEPVADDPAVHAPLDVELEPNIESVDIPLMDRAEVQMQRRHVAATSPAMRVDQRDRLDFPDARFEAESEPAPVAAADPDGSVSILLPLDADSGSDAGVDASPPPEFMRRAQRRARWQSPAMRVALGFVGLVLVSALLLQMGHHFRDSLAARWPVTKPLLTAWCDMAGCTIEAPRSIEDIAVESTALTRAAEPDSFKLAVTLRNRGAIALALPAVDLSLTDASGQLVSRRVLRPSEFRVGSTLIAPGTELPMQLVLTTGDARVTGYTVEIFYP